MRIEIRQGDITGQPDVDAIVNAANTELWMGSGVAGAIARRGGPDIEREAVAKGPVRLGEAVETAAGNLPNRYVIHAAAMGYRAEDHLAPRREGSLSSAPVIRLATTNSLATADRLGCRSIAFPALATGVGGFPVDECAEVMIGAARDYAAEHADTNIEMVAFVLFSESDYAAFSFELGKKGSQANAEE
jgi:O-acetyl-ADP-ribose deacetylase (regulator of RNase III)